MRRGGEGNADLVSGSGEAEELGVAASGVEATGAGEVDEDVGTEAADLEGEAEELANGARARGVAHVAVDEAGVLEHGGGGWGLGGDGKVGEEAALGVWKGARNEVERGESDESVAEGAEPIDQDTPSVIIHEDTPDVIHAPSVAAIFLWLLMMDATHLVRLQEEATRRWHEPAEMPAAVSELDVLVLEQHRANFDLWHEEDEARDPEATPEKIVQIKKAIDRLNQRRNDLMERIDQMLLVEAGEQRKDAPLHSETPGMMIDRLSILELKRFHTEEEIARAADEEHAERNRHRLTVLNEQRDDLRDALGDLWAEVMSGKRRFKLYRQMKMYNDPALNPVLYRARAAK